MESDISDWIINRLSVAIPQFNNMAPCPYAKQALLADKVEIKEVSSLSDLENELHVIAESGLSKDVLVLGCDPRLINPTELSAIVENANDLYLGNSGLIGLEDHPYAIEEVNGFETNQGTWALVLIQLKSKIEHARKILHAKGYYKNWSAEYYKEVVLDRS